MDLSGISLSHSIIFSTGIVNTLLIKISQVPCHLTYGYIQESSYETLILAKQLNWILIAPSDKYFGFFV